MRRRTPRTKHWLAAAVATACLFGAGAPALAGDDAFEKQGDHPLRILHYFVAPVGTLLEWTVTRPLYEIGSRVAPWESIDARPSEACQRERPGRSCVQRKR